MFNDFCGNLIEQIFGHEAIAPFPFRNGTHGTPGIASMNGLNFQVSGKVQKIRECFTGADSSSQVFFHLRGIHIITFS
jgi:hypothetical protein